MKVDSKKWAEDFRARTRVKRNLKGMGQPGPNDVAGMLLVSPQDYVDMMRLIDMAGRCLAMEAKNARI